jgi:hypothetical protein
MVTTVLAGCVLIGGAGVARAVSGGGYAPSEQDCSPEADSTSTKDSAEPGCHSAKVNVEDGNGKRYAEAGVDQMPDGDSTGVVLIGLPSPGDENFPHAGCAAASSNGTGGGPGTGCGDANGSGASSDLDIYGPALSAVDAALGRKDPGTAKAIAKNGFVLYLGADDNLNAGEHDGASGENDTDEAANGPSDGGAVVVYVTPGDPTNPRKPSLSDPVPVAGASEGFCADGICQEVTTTRQVIYNGGGGSGEERDAANYEGKDFESYDCGSGSQRDERACSENGGKTMNEYRADEAENVYAEPGVQIYADPDAQSSPIDPLYEAGFTDQPDLYPLPGAYVGTCGVVAGTPKKPAPASPVTNGAGQVVVKTGC